MTPIMQQYRETVTCSECSKLKQIQSIHNITERRKLGYFSFGTGNPIDDCWRCDPNWYKNRKRLADCGIGFGRNAIGGRDGRFYVVIDHIEPAYKRTSRRAIFLDYDGTVVHQSSVVKTPSSAVISVLNNLCSDPKDTMFIVSGRGQDSLSAWFAQCENLCIAAKHGYFIRYILAES